MDYTSTQAFTPYIAAPDDAMLCPEGDFRTGVRLPVPMAIVFQNTAATAQGIFSGNTGTLGLTVVNVNLDNFGTYAADRITDAWQVEYFGEGNARSSERIGSG